jgi:hypothetical protein
MTFDDLLDQAIALLQRRRRVTYRTLKRQFQLDEDALEDLKEERGGNGWSRSPGTSGHGRNP